MQYLYTHLGLLLMVGGTAMTGCLLGILLALGPEAPRTLIIMTAADVGLMIVAWPLWVKHQEDARAALRDNGLCSGCGLRKAQLWIPPVHLPVELCWECMETVYHFARLAREQQTQGTQNTTPPGHA